MKKIRNICCLLVMFMILTGCVFKRDTMENIDIYTTVYPINYLVNCLYGTNSQIYSIYPNGVNLDKYQLSDKKIAEYSSKDLFVFNSLDRDRDIAIKLINKNKNLKVIDVSVGMSVNNSVLELWLNPYNYLMMAQNLKNGLNQYITDPYLIKEIENNYEDLKFNLSKLDASLKDSINDAKYKTIVVDDDALLFLEKYNLKVISLEDNEKLDEPKINAVKKLIEEGSIKYIYTLNRETNAKVKKIVDDYKLELIYLNSMNSVDGDISNTNDNYLTIMNNNIEKINKELNK